jgi:hypothetical protein
MSLTNVYNVEPTLPMIAFPNYFSGAEATGADSVVASQSGQYVFIKNTGSAYTLDIPVPSPNTMFKFIVSGDLTSAVTISAPGEYILGSVLSSDGTAVTDGAIIAPITNVIIGNSAAIGDVYSFFADGSYWYLQGITGIHGSVTFS